MSWWLTPARVDRLVAADAQLRAAVPLARRVAFLETFPGVGSARLAAAASTRYAVRRHAPILLVDAAGAPQPAAVASGVGGPPAASGPGGGALLAAGLAPTAAAAPSRRRSHAQTLTDALDGLPTTERGVACLDLAALAQTGSAPPSPADWQTHVGTVARFFDIVVTDVGARRPVDVPAVASTSHAICVVTAPGRGAVEAAVHLAQQAIEEHCPAFVAVVAPGGPVPRAAARCLARGLSAPTHVLVDGRAAVELDEVAATGLRLALNRREHP